jgi:putative inorganic carbon (hco3(-)) transporter
MPVVIALAALSGPFPKAGVIALSGLVAVVLLDPRRRDRAGAMLGAMVLSPVLLLAAIWHSPQLSVVHRHPLEAAVLAIIGLAVLGGLATAIARRPWLIAPLAVVALPFRVPIAAGGTTSNLLVPLYVVVGGGVLAAIARALGRPGETADPPGAGERAGHDGAVTGLRRAPAGWLERLLALYVILYAVQAVYSSDFETALQQMVFFYVPFALLFSLLRDLRWTPRLLRLCLILVAGLAVLFALVGFAEYATKTLFLNPKLIAENNVHTYFAINSVFFDADIFGRFLALVMILLAAVLLYDPRRRQQLVVIGVLAVLWAGLVLTLSRSSLAALLLGLGILGAMRWRARPILLAAVVVVVIGVGAVAIAPKTFGLNQGLNGASSGRAGLVSGGLQLFGERPLWGYGSGSFETEYRRRHRAASATLSASHTIAVTIAAEQGLIGELPYLALVIVAGVLLVRGARRDPARAAVAAAFLALVLHTQLYADFLEDPLSWTLLGVGAALAYAARAGTDGAVRPEDELAAVAA